MAAVRSAWVGAGGNWEGNRMIGLFKREAVQEKNPYIPSVACPGCGLFVYRLEPVTVAGVDYKICPSCKRRLA